MERFKLCLEGTNLNDCCEQSDNMSLSLVCMYIVIGLCFLLFVNYKFLKLFIASLNQKFTTDANRNNIKVSNKNPSYNNDHREYKRQDIWSLPGPLRIPFLGTKWIYLWKYKMSKIHEVYRGKIYALPLPEMVSRLEHFCMFFMQNILHSYRNPLNKYLYFVV